jgi:MFS transporter, DHA1 family, tetracycline resistance protein
VIWTTVALDLVGFGIVVPILALYAEQFDASPTTIGVLGATFSAAQFVFAPIMGRVSDRVGRKPVILFSLFGTAIGSILCGVAGSLWLLFLARAIDGASGASVSVAQGAVTDVVPPEDRPRALGLLAAAFGVGFVIGPAIGGLAALGGQKLPFFIAAGIATINGIVAIWRLPETHGKSERAAAAILTEGLSSGGARTPALVRFAVVGFISTAAFSAFEATFSLFGQRRFDLTLASASAVFLGIGLVLVLVQGALIHPLTARFGSWRLLNAGMLTIAAGLALFSAAKQWPVFIGALLLLSVGSGIAGPSMLALVGDAAGSAKRGEALGFQQSASSLGRILGPLTGGVLFGRVGIPAPYLVGAALSVVAVVLVQGARVSNPVAASGSSGQ